MAILYIPTLCGASQRNSPVCWLIEIWLLGPGEIKLGGVYPLTGNPLACCGAIIVNVKLSPSGSNALGLWINNSSTLPYSIGGFNNCGELLKPKIVGFTTIIAVSYTHLDVYKRQS